MQRKNKGKKSFMDTNGDGIAEEFGTMEEFDGLVAANFGKEAVAVTLESPAE